MLWTEDERQDRTEPGNSAVVGGDRIALSKHEAAGNDFLVAVGPAPAGWLGPAAARWLCDRRLGVGADGLLGCGTTPDPHATLTMVLYNADGSRAEMSGNGIRCLVQAAVLSGTVGPGSVRVATDAGLRTVAFSAGPDGAAAGAAAVEMGSVRLHREVESPLEGTRAYLVDVGNPHLVVMGDMALEEVDLAAVHRDATGRLGGPVNVEVVRPTGPDALGLRVFERGAGETAACGTGSCAAAAVASSLGLVGDVVSVANPGGVLEVRLPPGGGPVVLSGPVRHVADVLVDRARLGGPDAGSRPDRASGAR